MAIDSTPDAVAAISAPRSQFLHDVLVGLRGTPKTLPSKYFYDAEGSRLFDRICTLDEYYLTRSELDLMQRHAGEMADMIGPNCRLVEFGSGSSIKTEILLDQLVEPAAYIPVDISPSYLHSAAERLRRRYPSLRILPLRADYTRALSLPAVNGPQTRTVVYFPGSTIGNFDGSDARSFLRRIAAVAGATGAALIGVDLKKDAAVLEAAYNDREGVTAAFNLNLLARINRELGGGFDLSQFRHQAVYNEEVGRVEMYLISRREQVVPLGGESIFFAAGEPVRTEYSYKYGIEDFQTLAASAGLRGAHTWTDARDWFSVHFLVA